MIFNFNKYLPKSTRSNPTLIEIPLSTMDTKKKQKQEIPIKTNPYAPTYK